MKLDPAEARQFTLYMQPEDSIFCQYGEITRRQWLQREADRIKARQPWRTVEVRENGDGKIALYCDRLYLDPGLETRHVKTLVRALAKKKNPTNHHPAMPASEHRYHGEKGDDYADA